MILKVARIGHPILRAVALPLRKADLRRPETQRLIDDMIETMHDQEGVGLAAPQVHVGLRLAHVEVPASDERATDGVPLTVLVNPVVTPLGTESEDGYEGCLSVPGLRGLVPRHRRVLVEALDRDAHAFRREAEGFFARVVQHECDHLDGVVYLQRMRDLSSLAFLEEFQRYVGGEEDGEA